MTSFKSEVDVPSLWQPPSDHQAWIAALVASLLASTAIHDDVLVHLGPVCAVKYDFCEQLLPLLVHNVLSTGPPECRDVLSRHASFGTRFVCLTFVS